MIQQIKQDVLKTSHTYTSQQKIFEHTSQRLDVCSAINTAVVETTIQLVSNFVQCVPGVSSYGSFDSLPHLLTHISARISCTRRKWILCWAVHFETARKMYVAHLLQTVRNILCCGVAIFKTSGI
jgi:hypothetical protein